MRDIKKEQQAAEMFLSKRNRERHKERKLKKKDIKIFSETKKNSFEK